MEKPSLPLAFQVLFLIMQWTLVACAAVLSIAFIGFLTFLTIILPIYSVTKVFNTM